MPRLFIAVPVDDAVRSNLARLGKGVDARAVAWVKPENMHITLAFLGEVEERRVAEVEDAAFAATEGQAAPLKLAAQGIGAFPNERKARVLWAGLTGDVPALIALQKALMTELRAAGFQPDDKRFHPHITIARFRSPQAVPERLPRLQEFGEWTATELQLIESQLHRTGARYKVRADIPLVDEDA